MDPATEISQAIEQAKNALSESQRDAPYGKLLFSIGPHMVHIGEQIRKFWTASSQLEALDSLAGLVSDELNCSREHLRAALETQKTQSSWCEYLRIGEAIETKIAKIHELSDESIKEAFDIIRQQVEEAKVAVARDLLRTSSMTLAINMIIPTIQVIDIYYKLAQASNLVESSRRKLAPGGLIAERIEKANEHLTKAAEFLNEGDLESANFRISRATKCSMEVHTELNGIQLEIKGQIRTLQTGKILAGGIAISTTLLSIQQVATILLTPKAGISLSLKVFAWAAAAVSFSLIAASAGAYLISDANIKELQEVLEAVENKLASWRNLSDKIDELSFLLESQHRRKKNTDGELANN